MDAPPSEWWPSPGPWGPLMAETPTMAALLRDLVAGGHVDALRT